MKPSESEPQDFELIELLIQKPADVGMRTPTRHSSEIDVSFVERFQSFINQVPSYLHSVKKEGFFTHFFLGSFSTLLDTQIAAKLNIKKVYFRFDTARVLKLVVIRNGQIQSVADAVSNISLFSISEDENDCQFTSGELEKILQENIEVKGLAAQDIRKKIEDVKKKVKNEIEYRLVLISKKEKGVSVEMKDKKILDSDTSQEFRQIVTELQEDLENSISSLSNSRPEIVKESLSNIFVKIQSRHEKLGSLPYGKNEKGDNLREAAHHGFVAGVFMNFHYRYNLKIYLENFVGRGYADIILLVRGPNRSFDSVPIVIEMKSATVKQLNKLKDFEESRSLTEVEENKKNKIIEEIKNSLDNGLQQVKEYVKGFQPNSIGFETFSRDVLYMAVNLDSPEVYNVYFSPANERKISPPAILQLLEKVSQWNGEEDKKDQTKNEIKVLLERIYYTFPGVGEKVSNCLGKFLLGQLILVDKFEELDLKKSVFLYDEYPLESRLRRKEMSESPVTTFVLNQKEGSGIKVFIFYIKEGGEGEFSNKKVPISVDSSKESEIIEIHASLSEAEKSDFFSIDEITRYESVSQYQEGRELFKGKLEDVPYTHGLKEAFDEALLGDQNSEWSGGKYGKLLEKIGEGMFPFKVLIRTEADFKHVLTGAFRAYSNLILKELSGKIIVSVLPEFQIGREKRVDIVTRCIKKEDDGKVRESIPTVLELKGPRKGASVEMLEQEVNDQIAKRAQESFNFKALTDGDRVRFGGIIFDDRANNGLFLITESKKGFSIVDVSHSSIRRRTGPTEEILDEIKILFEKEPFLLPSDDSQPKRSISDSITCTSKPKRMKTKRAADVCLLDMDENKKVNKEKTGIEVNEENFDESKINDGKLRVYQEKIKDEGSEINNQLNKLIIEIQQAQAIKHFSQTNKVIIEKLFPVLENIDEMQSENRSYFEQICKLNLLRIISSIIKDEDFKNLLFNSPEKLIKDQSLLENVFASVENLISDQYKQQQLQYENFEDLENRINEEIVSKSAETRSITSQDVNKTDLLNYVFESVGLSLLMSQGIEVSTNLQKRIYYETLVDLGSLIYDHKNHIQITHSGDQHTIRINSLVERIKGSKLLSIAYDLYYLRENGGDADQSDLYSSEVKSRISLYGNIDSKYRLNDIYNKFDIDEIKSYFSEDELKKFGAEFEAYDKEVITIHSTQVFTGGNEVHVKVKDNNGNVKQLIIGSIEGIKNIVNYDYNKETLEVKLKVASDKEYTVTCEKRDGEVKYYLNIEGYKAKVGDIIKNFTKQVKGSIRWKLDQQQGKVELSETKKDIEAMADIEVSDQDYIREVRQNLLAQGVSESTFDQFKKQLDHINEEAFKEYVSNISKKLTENNIEFSNGKFNTAKVTGAKGSKFFSIMAIYDLFNSVEDVPTLGRHDSDDLKRIFGINGILDAMNDVRESISTSYMRSSGEVVTKIRPDSAMGRMFRKIPLSTRKAFVKVISNPVVESITFATVAYQFGYSIDAIAKGDHHPLNYYFATSNGIKLASMSMRPISIGVSSAMRGISATTRGLRGLSAASKFLGKVSRVAIGIDLLVTTGVKLYERGEYTEKVAGRVPLLPGNEQAEVFFAKVIKTFTERDIEKEYEDSIILKEQLLLTKIIANDLLNKNQDIGAVVLYVDKIEMRYDEIIKSAGNSNQDTGLAIRTQICTFEKVYSPSKWDYGLERNLSTLNVHRILSMISHTLVLGQDLEQLRCDFISIFSSRDEGRKCRESLDNKQAYFIDLSKKHLPHLSLNEYRNDGLRVVSMPRDYNEKTACSNIMNYEHYSTSYGLLGTEYKCNVDRVYRECIKVFTLSDQPFIFTKLSRQTSQHSVAYLLGPKKLIAAENYPAVMHIPKGRVNYKGSEYHDNTFIINYDTYGHIRGGTANNTIVMNYSPSMIFVRLGNGIIDAAGSKIELANIHNYISHSTANQNITTGCKTRYVDAGKGGGNNTIKNSDVNCQGKDYEIRKVNGKDVHSRSTKQATFIIDQNSGSGATISFGDLKSKENLDVIYVKSFDISQLRINEHQNGYRLNFVTDEEVKASVRIDSFEKLVTKMETAVTIVIQDKSLPDIIKDMVRQKLSHTGADIDDKIIENSKKRSKAVIIADITGSENTTAYAVARDIAESSNNLGTTVSRIQVIGGDVVLNYAVNHLSQIKLIPNNGTNISDEEQREYNRLLFQAVERENLNRIRDLIDMGADVEAKQSNTTPLIKAVHSNRSGVIDLLLDRGANINAKGIYNWTAAKWAINYGRENLVVQLVNRGADIGYKDNMGHTLLDTAKRFGQRKIADFLREKQSEYDRDLLTAASNVDIDKVRDLLNRGANIEAVNGDESTPLHCAAWHGRLNVAKLLFDRGANIEAKDINNSTPLLYAIQGVGSVDLVKFLVNEGANINVKNNFGQTPLEEANKLSNPEIADFLKGQQRLVQRKRRHHHGGHTHNYSEKQKYLQKKERSIYLESKEARYGIKNDNFIIENNQATGGANKPSSWINDLFGWVKSSVSELLGSKSSTTTKSSISQVDAKMDVNGTIMLLDVIVRKFTGKQYIPAVDQSIPFLEARGYALNITNRFEKVLNKTAIKSGISVTNLNFDPVVVQSAIIGKIINGKFSETAKTLYSIAKEACPEFKQTDKFLDNLKSNLEEVLAKEETMILQQKVEKPSKVLGQEVSRKVELSKKPDTFLNGTSVVQGISRAIN